MQPVEVPHTVAVARHERAHAGQGRESIDYPTDAARMVVAGLSEVRGRATMLVQLDATAIEFDRVQPLLAPRRGRAQGRGSWFGR